MSNLKDKNNAKILFFFFYKFFNNNIVQNPYLNCSLDFLKICSQYRSHYEKSI
jgi:hypothetical protein